MGRTINLSRFASAMEPLARVLPRPVRRLSARALRGGYYLLDQADRARGRDRGLAPPRHLVHLIGSGFEVVGQEYLRHFRELGQLGPDGAVLDIGCGVGRMALPLTTYLSAEGRYEGFDIGAAGVRWCQEQITPRYPNFRFTHVAVKNGFYEKRGVSAAGFRFPYPDNHFDFVFATSLFTHLLPDGMRNYIAESARVLRPRGRFLATFFLLNDESLALVAEGRGEHRFDHDYGAYRTTDPEAAESAIAFPEDAVRAQLAGAGLTIEEPTHYGSWCGRDHTLSYQDIVVARKG